MDNYPLIVNCPHGILIFLGPNAFVTPTFHETRLQPARVSGLRQEEVLISNYQIIQNEGKNIIFLLCLQFKIILSENSASWKQGSNNRIASWTDRELFFPNFLNIIMSFKEEL